MASENVAAAAPSAPATNAHPLREVVTSDRARGFDPNAFDFEEVGHRVGGLLYLAHWIERARGLTEEIEAATARDASLREQFRARGIPYANCSWVEEEENGLLQLLMMAARDVRAMTAAGMASQGLGNEAKGVRHG